MNKSEDTKNVKRLLYNVLATGSVVVFEGSIGLITNSLSLVGDAAHSCTDLISSIIGMIFLKISSRPADENHTYGHEKMEYVGTLISGIILLLLGVSLIYESSIGLIASKEKMIGGIAYVAIFYVFIVETFRTLNSYIGKLKGKGKSILRAELYHALADMSGTIVALLGVYLNNIGIKGADEFGGLILGFLIVYGSVKLVYDSSLELSDYIPRGTLPKVEEAVRKTKGVASVERIRVRKSGEGYFVDAVIKVPEEMKIEEAHEIASEVEKNVKKVLPESDVTVHVEPQNRKEK